MNHRSEFSIPGLAKHKFVTVNINRFGKISCPDLRRSWSCCQSGERQAFLIPYYRPANGGHGDSMRNWTLNDLDLLQNILQMSVLMPL